MKNIIHSAAIYGISCTNVEIESDLDTKKNTKSNVSIIGFTVTQELSSKKRVLNALKPYTEQFFKENNVLFNLYSTSSAPRNNNDYDLPIAVSILQQAGIIKKKSLTLNNAIFIGEMSIHGEIKPIKGALVLASALKKLNKKRIIISSQNAQEVSMINGVEIIPVNNIAEVIVYINDGIVPSIPKKEIENKEHTSLTSLDDIKGNNYAKRALEIAAAGHHNLLLCGAPGVGKTLLAKNMIHIMPDLNKDEIIDITKIYSVANQLHGKSSINVRPFRSPHHTCSTAALLGGGRTLLPGELSLSHHGVLFLDEFTELSRETIESLREPLESKQVNLSRYFQHVSYPANCILIAAHNPCPCGFSGSKVKKCTCTLIMINSYKAKLSGPILDRMDMQLRIREISFDEYKNQEIPERYKQETIKKNVLIAQEIQRERFSSTTRHNSDMTPREIEKYCKVDTATDTALKAFFEKHNISMRSLHKILKMARTIADIDQSESILLEHVSEALMYKHDETL